MVMALNNPRRLICHKTKKTNHTVLQWTHIALSESMSIRVTWLHCTQSYCFILANTVFTLKEKTIHIVSKDN